MPHPRLAPAGTQGQQARTREVAGDVRYHVRETRLATPTDAATSKHDATAKPRLKSLKAPQASASPDADTDTDTEASRHPRTEASRHPRTKQRNKGSHTALPRTSLSASDRWKVLQKIGLRASALKAPRDDLPVPCPAGTCRHVGEGASAEQHSPTCEPYCTGLPTNVARRVATLLPATDRANPSSGARIAAMKPTPT